MAWGARNLIFTQAWAALYLNHALEKFNCDKLEFLWLFSSVATYGNPGQSPYSAANSLLDSLSRYRNAKGLPCTAMQWAGLFCGVLLHFRTRRPPRHRRGVTLSSTRSRETPVQTPSTRPRRRLG